MNKTVMGQESLARAASERELSAEIEHPCLTLLQAQRIMKGVENVVRAVTKPSRTLHPIDNVLFSN